MLKPLSTDGMLVKRPLLIGDDLSLVHIVIKYALF